MPDCSAGTMILIAVLSKGDFACVTKLRVGTQPHPLGSVMCLLRREKRVSPNLSDRSCVYRGFNDERITPVTQNWFYSS